MSMPEGKRRKNEGTKERGGDWEKRRRGENENVRKWEDGKERRSVKEKREEFEV